MRRPSLAMIPTLGLICLAAGATSAEGLVGGARFIPVDRTGQLDPTGLAGPTGLADRTGLAGVAEPTAEPETFNPPPTAGLVRTAGHEADPNEPERVTPVAALQPAPPPARFDKQLIEVEVRLARQIVKAPSEWRFDELKDQAARLMNRAADDDQRMAVRELLDRMDRFAGVAERRRRLEAAPPAPLGEPLRPPLQRVASPLAPAPRAPAVLPQQRTPSELSVPSAQPVTQAQPVPPAQNAQTPSYDAVGELRPVVSKRPGAPGYALVDKEGRVVTFVTPVDGLELRPLLGKQVGARGARGFMPEYGRRHLTARNVTTLGTVRR